MAELEFKWDCEVFQPAKTEPGISFSSRKNQSTQSWMVFSCINPLRSFMTQREEQGLWWKSSVVIADGAQKVGPGEAAFDRQPES